MIKIIKIWGIDDNPSQQLNTDYVLIICNWIVGERENNNREIYVNQNVFNESLSEEFGVEIKGVWLKNNNNDDEWMFCINNVSILVWKKKQAQAHTTFNSKGIRNHYNLNNWNRCGIKNWVIEEIQVLLKFLVIITIGK